jgi:predicted AlkP superfamily phosphohydrolase/phosphomutase
VTLATGAGEGDRRSVGRPILVVGLDGAEPSLVFDRWRADLPTLDRLMSAGLHGRLESTIPAITVPAWASMMTGLDPGQLGLYGFRNRVDRSYDNLAIANARSVGQPRVWDRVSAAGGTVGLISVPQTYPIKPINGDVVSCFLTPSAASEYAHPPSLKAEIEGWIEGEYLVDVPDFRSEDKARILRDIYRMADQHYEICRRLLSRRRYDYFMTVDMGIDRIQHAFWKSMDPAHPKHEPGNPFERAIHDYYVHVDGRIAELLELTPEETIVVVVSDHGAQAMLGGICINEWLLQERYLALDSSPTTRTSMEAAGVAWAGTRAWGEGGYYGRVTLNVAGREPSGRVPAERYEAELVELASRLEGVPDPDGRSLGSAVYRPEAIYREVRNVAPDLLVYFGPLTWRSVGSVGMGALWTFENDLAPDDANHSQHGIFILHDPRHPGGGRRLGDQVIYDVAPTLLSWLDLPVPAGLRGRPMDLQA